MVLPGRPRGTGGGGPLPGGDQLPFFDSMHTFGSPGQTAAAWPGFNFDYFLRFRLAKPMPVNALVYWVGAAAGNVSAAVGTINPTTNAFAQLGASGSVAAAGANALQTLSFGGTIWLPPATDLVAGLGATSTSLTLLRHSVGVGALSLGQAWFLGSTFPIPATATLTPGTGAAAFMPWFWLGMV